MPRGTDNIPDPHHVCAQVPCSQGGHNVPFGYWLSLAECNERNEATDWPPVMLREPVGTVHTDQVTHERDPHA